MSRVSLPRNYIGADCIISSTLVPLDSSQRSGMFVIITKAIIKFIIGIKTFVSLIFASRFEWTQVAPSCKYKSRADGRISGKSARIECTASDALIKLHNKQRNNSHHYTTRSADMLLRLLAFAGKQQPQTTGHHFQFVACNLHGANSITIAESTQVAAATR